MEQSGVKGLVQFSSLFKIAYVLLLHPSLHSNLACGKQEKQSTMDTPCSDMTDFPLGRPTLLIISSGTEGGNEGDKEKWNNRQIVKQREGNISLDEQSVQSLNSNRTGALIWLVRVTGRTASQLL